MLFLVQTSNFCLGKKNLKQFPMFQKKCLYFFSMFYRPFREPVETKVAEKKIPDKTKSLCGGWGTVSVWIIGAMAKINCGWK